MRPLYIAFTFTAIILMAAWGRSTPDSRAEAPETRLTERPLTAESARVEFAPHQIVVRFRRDAPEAGIASLNGDTGAAPTKAASRTGARLLSLPPGTDIDEALAVYRDSPLVEKAGRSVIGRASEVPDDTNYSYQWHMHDTEGGIHAESAWDLSPAKGSGVTLAVIDTGVAYEDYSGSLAGVPQTFGRNPDLAQTTFVKPWDFVNQESHANDDNGHGTHVTGTISQDTNNGYGVAGVASNSAIMPLKALDFAGSGLDFDIIEAVYYAVDNGADVINMSLGFPGTGLPDGNGDVCTDVIGLAEALEYAYENGVVVVAASGNEGADTVSCPAAYPTVIAVGATRYDGQVPAYANSGDGLDISAAGGSGGLDQNGDGFVDGVLQETYCYDWLTLFLTGPYDEFCDVFMAGTSMASPHVAGAAALLLGENSSLTPDEVRFYLESTARDRGPAGWDASFGWGALDAAAALAALGSAPPTPPTATPTPTPPAPSTPMKDPLIDTDGDGCSNGQEQGTNPNMGGLRDHESFWDFFDTPDDANVRDRQINLAGDILRVVGRYGANDLNGTTAINRNTDPLSPPPPSPQYHPAFDRGRQVGPNSWNRAPADGAINIPDDILGVVAQFGHDCR